MRTPSRIFLAGASVLAVGALAPGAAIAAGTTVTGTVSGSTLSVTPAATASFSANLDTGDQNPTYTIPSAVQDTRGTGSGWNLTLTSTQFTTGGATPSTLATTASSVTGVAVTNGSGTNTAPTNSVSYSSLGVPAGATAPTAVKIFNAAANTGMGKFTITPTIGVFVPQNSATGSYTSTLTLSIVSGP